MMKLHIKEYKSWSWLFCTILYNLSRLSPFRDKNLWVFGNFEGKVYDDNTKYLFEYVSEIYSEKVTAIWFTKSKAKAIELRQKGLKAVVIGSGSSIKYLLRCGVVFYTHSLYDFGKFPLMGGAYVVTTWHGMGFKKIYGSKWTGFGRYLRKVKDFFFNWIHCDCACLTSEYTRHQFEKTLGIDKEKIFLTGQPRNDILLHPMDKSEILSFMGIPKGKNIILYFPTWRNSFQKGKTLTDIINDLVQCDELNRILSVNNSVFVVKLHPATPNLESLRLNHNFVIANKCSKISTQELIGCGDIMITDYSSCFVDYSLLNRPIVFYMPDEKEYMESCGGMEQDFYRISKLCQCRTPEELASIISGGCSLAVSTETNLIFDTPSTHTSSFTQNVIDVVCRNVGIEL